jgi:acyl carrier protein
MTAEKDKGSGTRYLCAYVKADQTISNNTSPKQDFIPQLKRYLAEKLPNYMIPSYFVLIDEIPLTSNGKINRKSLPDPKSAAPGSKTTYVKPETYLGQVIAETWQEVLKKNIIDIDDNFFDLGGNSLDFIMMGNQLKEKLNRQIPAVTLFTYPTIRSLERYLNPEEGTEAVPVTDSQSGPTHHPGLIEEGKNLMKQTLKKFDPGY